MSGLGVLNSHCQGSAGVVYTYTIQYYSSKLCLGIMCYYMCMSRVHIYHLCVDRAITIHVDIIVLEQAIELTSLL